jgi:hypothetical protein
VPVAEIEVCTAKMPVLGIFAGHSLRPEPGTSDEVSAGRRRPPHGRGAEFEVCPGKVLVLRNFPGHSFDGSRRDRDGG